jgi:hypothetical protein
MENIENFCVIHNYTQSSTKCTGCACGAHTSGHVTDVTFGDDTSGQGAVT